MASSTLFSILLVSCLVLFTIQAPTKSSEKDLVVEKPEKLKAPSSEIAEKEEEEELVAVRLDNLATIGPKSKNGENGEDESVNVESNEHDSMESSGASGEPDDSDAAADKSISAKAPDHKLSKGVSRDDTAILKDESAEGGQNEKLILQEKTNTDDSDDSDSDSSDDSDDSDDSDESTEQSDVEKNVSADSPSKSMDETIESSGSNSSTEQ